MKTILTLTFIFRGDQVLLGKKKQGFGIGRWNGFGGKVEEGEEIEVAAKREVQEETGLEIIKLEKRAVLTFTFEHKPEKPLEVHVFQAGDWSGEPYESEEMLPQWFSISKIPLQEFWDADKKWLPLFLEGKKIIGNFHYDKTERLLSHTIKEVNDI